MTGAEGLRAHVVVQREHFVVDVSLQVPAGATVAVMGPSGAGTVSYTHLRAHET